MIKDNKYKMRKELIWLVVFVLSISSVLAEGAFDDAWWSGALESIKGSPTIIFILVLVALGTLLFFIIASAARFVPMFKSGDNLSKFGKGFAATLSILCCLGIGWRILAATSSTEEALESILGPMGAFGGFAFAGAIFMLVYQGMGANSPNNRFLFAGIAAMITMSMFSLFVKGHSWLLLGSVMMLVAGGLWFGINALSKNVNSRREGTQEYNERQNRLLESDRLRRERGISDDFVRRAEISGIDPDLNKNVIIKKVS